MSQNVNSSGHSRFSRAVTTLRTNMYCTKISTQSHIQNQNDEILSSSSGISSNMFQPRHIKDP